MPHLRVNRKLEPLLLKPKPIKVAVGGRGSGKSIGFGDIFTMKMATERADIYCLREYQDSVKDSVHRVFESSIKKRLELDGWDIQKDKVIAPNGASTIYRGANRNPDSLQSANDYKYSWFEEAQRASQDSIDKLLPTIIRNPGCECWFSANPQNSKDPFSKRFITPYIKQLERDGIYEDELHLIVMVNWRDNPWWNEEQEKLRKWDYENLDRAKYDWIWEGKFNDAVENALIKPEWFDAAIDAHLKLGFKPTGARVSAFDPSDMGPDSKGYTLRQGSVLLDARENPIGDANEGCDWATDLAIMHDADLFVWDADGMGIVLQRQIAQAFRGKKISYSPFKGSESPDNPHEESHPTGAYETSQKIRTNKDTYFNKRAQFYCKLADRLYNAYRAVVKKEYVNPDEMLSIGSEIECIQSLRSEICSVPRIPNGNGKIQLMSKKDMKAKLGIDSPNLADPTMMGLMMPVIEDSYSEDYEEDDYGECGWMS